MISSRPPSKVAGIRRGVAVLLGALAALAVPPAVTSVGAWAAAHRVVAAEAGSPHPGKWNPALVPYGHEIEDCVSFTHPCTDVVVKKSAQVGVSEIAINLFFSIAHANPCPVLIVLPTTDEVRKFNKLKLQPNIDATPAIARVILDQKSRDADSSTASLKRFRGGFCVITGANSAVGLQMISARVIIFEEPSGYPHDAGGRGDPIAQAYARGKAWNDRHPKRFWNGTPELAGTCRITAKYEESDQRRYYVACPHCGARQILVWNDGKSGLFWRSARKPHGAYYVCGVNGCVIESTERLAMIAGGVWLKTYVDMVDVVVDGVVTGQQENAANPSPPAVIAAEDFERWAAARGPHGDSAGRQPGFAIWQAYSPFVPWDDTVAEYFTAKAKPNGLKVFAQQALGEPFEERGEAPPAEKLVEIRGRWPSRRVPPWAYFITGAADVQGNRIEWGVRAWGRDLQCALIDHGVIEGDPAKPEPWVALGAIVDRTYEDGRGQAWDIDAFGVDAGYLSSHVYRFVWRRMNAERRTRKVFALDGRDGWKLPPLGTPKPVDIDFNGRKIGSTMLWPVGTYDMKSEIYAGLTSALEATEGATEFEAGTEHFNERVDKGYFEQLTAEHLEDQPDRRGRNLKVWVKPPNRPNEALDIAVYSRALAHHLADSLTEVQWRALEAQRWGPVAERQADLFAWQGQSQESRASVDPSMSAAAQPEAAVTAPAQPPERRGSVGVPAGPAPARSLSGTGRKLS